MTAMEDLPPYLAAPDATLRTVTELIDRNAQGIALICDSERHLIGTITDGDLRRAILSGTSPEEPVRALLERKAREDKMYPAPITALAGTSPGDLIHLMNERSIRHLPIIDADRRVVGLALLSELVREYELPLRAVVMAGGLGTRLRPLTERTPKPMLPVGGRPILEHILEQLRASGINRVNVTTHFHPDVITEHFGDGRDFGVDLTYVPEDEPLGTAGGLGQLFPEDQPLLVMNGDILTGVDFRAMLDFHREHAAEMTLAVREEEIQLPFGVVETRDFHVARIDEKPSIRRFVNAGIYLFEPSVRTYIPAGEAMDIPHLVECLIVDGRRVVSFPVHEYWLDVGQPHTYEQAERDYEAGKIRR
jgi:dTDP-glucose pyrophosphorylase/CBS domain-containing protein